MFLCACACDIIAFYLCIYIFNGKISIYINCIEVVHIEVDIFVGFIDVNFLIYWRFQCNITNDILRCKNYDCFIVWTFTDIMLVEFSLVVYILYTYLLCSSSSFINNFLRIYFMGVVYALFWKFPSKDIYILIYHYHYVDW